MSREREQTIALAAIMQALQLVDDLANSGKADREQLAPLLLALFEFDPPSTEAVFGRLSNLARGIDGLGQLLTGNAQDLPGNTTHYAMSVILLAKRLAGDRDRLSIIHDRLGKTRQSLDSDDPDALVAPLARLYQDVISTDSHRILVTGVASHLRDPRIADQVRALLFAAIRAAILWLQLGGRRWRVLLLRSRYVHWARTLSSEAQASRLH